ncbi:MULTISPECIES: hypothetical protein [Thiorhodovibrio]|uniref:hypothetical protein n=1 Tax=Thiorhodovibrio TaxID=61593 RepID=UPI001913192C|nr:MULTISPECIES: hypothetical protein [Thiorhodovibrio]
MIEWFLTLMIPASPYHESVRVAGKKEILLSRHYPGNSQRLGVVADLGLKDALSNPDASGGNTFAAGDACGVFVSA